MITRNIYELRTLLVQEICLSQTDQSKRGGTKRQGAKQLAEQELGTEPSNEKRNYQVWKTRPPLISHIAGKESLTPEQNKMEALAAALYNLPINQMMPPEYRRLLPLMARTLAMGAKYVWLLPLLIPLKQAFANRGVKRWREVNSDVEESCPPSKKRTEPEETSSEEQTGPEEASPQEQTEEIDSMKKAIHANPMQIDVTTIETEQDDSKDSATTTSEVEENLEDAGELLDEEEGDQDYNGRSETIFEPHDAVEKWETKVDVLLDQENNTNPEALNQLEVASNRPLSSKGSIRSESTSMVSDDEESVDGKDALRTQGSESHDPNDAADADLSDDDSSSDSDSSIQSIEFEERLCKTPIINRVLVEQNPSPKDATNTVTHFPDTTSCLMKIETHFTWEGRGGINDTVEVEKNHDVCAE